MFCFFYVLKLCFEIIFIKMKKVFVFILLFTLSVFCEKRMDLPRYQIETRVDDDVAEFLSNQDSLHKNKVNKVAQKRVARDILGRLTKDTTIYVLKEDLYEKRISVGIMDLSLRNKQGKNALEFQKNQYGNKNVRLNGKEISLDDYHKIVQEHAERKKTPFIRYETLTAEEIKNIIFEEKPVRIFLKKSVSVKYDVIYYHYQIIFNYTGVDNMHLIGAKGNGVGLFFEDAGCADTSVLNVNYYVRSNTCSGVDLHATKVAKLLQLTAPEAMIVNYAGGAAVIPEVDHNANRFDPKLEIGSYSWHYTVDSCSNNIYCYFDQELDQHIYEDRLVYFVAAGNMENSSDVYVGSPGKALNAITVGAVHPHTGEYINESKWGNSEIRNQKPEIANYTNITLEYEFLGGITGTSASTPLSAAIAANVMSLDTNLKRHPEVIKSMFLIYATNPIYGASSHDIDDGFHVTDKLPYFESIADFRYRWWSGSNSDFFDSNEKIIFTETDIAYGQHCRAAISWLTSGQYAGQYKLLAQDIDLFVYQGTTLIASSESAHNPFEVIDFNTQSNTDLRFEIKRYANSYSDDVVLGFTMRCDNE